jgi:hypothetical protein
VEDDDSSEVRACGNFGSFATFCAPLFLCGWEECEKARKQDISINAAETCAAISRSPHGRSIYGSGQGQ